jgi:NAD(P)-dependent dehydrogenase (short-subunit alcohol dehydrogenase family)
MIFTASISGVHPAYGGVLYVPAKHAIIGLTRRLALELAPQIRVNAVAPGYVPTGLAGTQALGQQPRVGRQPPAAESYLMKRVPQIVDYTGLYVFLASADSITMTGQVLVADSGVTLQRT